MELPRAAASRLPALLAAFRAVAVVGARQVGKSTLVSALTDRHYVTLDDLGALAAAAADPRGFVAGLPRPVTIDEVQRVPELLLAVKQVVDRDRARGQFLLTGSSRLDTLRGIRESLAGRAAVLELGPLTWGELHRAADRSPIERVLSHADLPAAAAGFAALRGAPRIDGADVLAGGFPEPRVLLDAAARPRWFREYVRTYIERDVPAVVRVEDVPTFVRFVTACAATSSQLLDLSALSRDLGIALDTVRRWVGVLETTFVATRRAPLWRNVRTRLVKTPELFLLDAGLMASLLGVEDWTVARERNLAGALLETWVHQQLQTWCLLAEPPVELHFYRSHARVEVDFVLVRGARMMPLEVKATATPRPEHAKGIEAFVAQFPRNARYGLVLHLGDEVHPLTAHALAVPLARFLGP